MNIFLAYNSNIDNIDPRMELEKLTNKKPKPNFPKEIKTKKDIVSAALFCMNSGEGHELQMPSKLSNKLKEKLNPKKRSLGGQAGIMSNYLSKLNADCTVYTPFLSKFKEKLFEKNVKLISDKKKEKNNWIFEFKKGDELFGVKSKTTGRFIAGERNKEYVFNYNNNNNIKNFDCAIFAGFQNIVGNPKKQLNKASKLIKNSKIPVHFEFVYDPIIEDKILEKIATPCYSMGADSVEIKEIAKILGHTPIDYTKKEKMIKLLKKINKDLNLERLYLHTPEYFLTVGKNLNKKTKKAMEFAEISAASHALGNFKSAKDLKKGKKVKQNKTKSVLNKDYIIVPNRMVKNPKRVVGLGDIVSASLFLGEQALEK